MFLLVPANRSDHRRVHAWQALPRRYCRVGEREEIADLADFKTDQLASRREDQDGPLITFPPRLAQQPVRIQDGQERAANVDNAGDGCPHPRNAGGGKRRQNLPHNPCRSAANQVADAEYDGVQNRSISHLY